MHQASLCVQAWKAKGQSEFRPITFERPELWVTKAVAEIAYLQSSPDEKPGCQTGKILILMGKKFGKHVSHQARSAHTDKSSFQPSVSFSPYLVRKHIYKCNLFHFLVAEASLMGFQNDTTEEQSLTSMFGEKTQERQHLPWGTEAVSSISKQMDKQKYTKQPLQRQCTSSHFFWIFKVNQSQARGSCNYRETVQMFRPFSCGISWWKTAKRNSSCSKILSVCILFHIK